MSDYVKYGVFGETKSEKETNLADEVIARIKRAEAELEVEFVQIEWNDIHQTYMVRVKELTNKYEEYGKPLNSTRLVGTVSKEEKEALEVLASL